MAIIISILVACMVVAGITAGVLYYIKWRRRDNNTQCFQKPFEMTKFPMIVLFHEGKRLNFIIDTGCTKSLISDSAIDLSPYETIDEVNSWGVDGIKTVCPVKRITLSYGDLELPFDFSVRDITSINKTTQKHGVTAHGLIGSDFLAKYKYVLDFKKCLVYTDIKKKDIK